MRGKVFFCSLRVDFLGITPAYAGKRDSAQHAKGWTADHPRVCGEKVCSYEFECKTIGSPPRMRGKVRLPCRWAISLRITPAYAGKSQTASLAACKTRDHPRVCGEKSKTPIYDSLAEGSPPRMRGKADASINHLILEGITPAYAGKRVSVCWAGAVCWDHPRVCGEKTKKIP